MAKMGRPRIEFDLKQVEMLGKIQCTLEELAAVLDVNTETIERRMKDDVEFCAAYKKGRENGKASLRRKQWELALAGNVVMNIWLGKQYLGQADKQELTGKDGEGIEFVVKLIGGKANDDNRLENQ